MPELATETLSCPRCRSANPAQARFCGTCGQPLQGQGNVPPPPPPLPPPLPPPVQNRGLLLGGASGTAGPVVVATDNESAFALALNAIQAARGTVVWQGPPQSVRFEAIHRSFMLTGGFKVKYDGTVTLMPAGARQTQASVALEMRSSSIVPLIATDLVCTFMLALGSAQAQAMLMFVVLFGLACTAYQYWALSNNVKNELAQKILRTIGETAYGGVAVPLPNAAANGRRGVPSPGAVIQLPVAPGVGPIGPGAAVPQPPAKSVTDQLRELGELRQLGVLTDAEFEAKKAELLARI